MTLDISNPAIPRGETVIISGATGLLGSYVCDEALAAGYKVRGTTRSVKRGEWLSKLFEERYGPGNFELVEVKDMGVGGAYDAVTKGASGFIHVANDMGDAPDSSAAITLAVNGALNALRAAHAAGIKRFVYTSSSFAVTQPKPDKVFTITEETYNEEAVEKVRDGTADGSTVYAASKVECERALVKWGKENDPEMVINMGIHSLPKCKLRVPTRA